MPSRRTHSSHAKLSTREPLLEASAQDEARSPLELGKLHPSPRVPFLATNLSPRLGSRLGRDRSRRPRDPTREPLSRGSRPDGAARRGTAAGVFPLRAGDHQRRPRAYMHATRDPSPEEQAPSEARGTWCPLDVFESRDLLPTWLNVFHVTTRSSVIRGEILFPEGAPYSVPLVDDTIRNLRRLPGVPQLSMVLAVAVAGSAPDRVVLVVITKDVWSLRLNWSMVLTPGGLDNSRCSRRRRISSGPTKSSTLNHPRAFGVHLRRRIHGAATR